MTLHALGVITFIMYGVYTIIFEAWKSRVNYPPRSPLLTATGLVFEGFLWWLLITVVF